MENTKEVSFSSAISSSINVQNSAKPNMAVNMELPKYYELVRIVAQIGAVLGCLSGLFIIFNSLSAFDYNAVTAFTGIFGGAFTIIVSLASLGIIYCFLTIVQAQVESRNAILNYTSNRD